MALSDGEYSERGVTLPVAHGQDDTIAVVRDETQVVDGTSTVSVGAAKTSPGATGFANAVSAFANISSASARQPTDKAAETATFAEVNGRKPTTQSSEKETSATPIGDLKASASGRRKTTAPPSGAGNRSSSSSSDTDNESTSSSDSSTSSSRATTTSDNDSLPALEEQGGLLSSARRADPVKSRKHVKKSENGKSEISASSGADRMNDDSPPPLEPTTPSPSTSARFQVPVSRKKRGEATTSSNATVSNSKLKTKDDAASSKRKLGTSSDSSANEKVEKSSSSRANAKKAASASISAAAAGDGSDEPPALLDDSHSGDSDNDDDDTVENIVQRQLESMVEAIADSDDEDEDDGDEDEDEDGEDDEEWDTPPSLDDDDDEPMTIHQMMLDAMDTDSEEDDDSSYNSPAADDDDDVQAVDVAIVTVNADGTETAAAAPSEAVERDADGMPALEDPEVAERARALARTRAQFAARTRATKRQRAEAKTPPDSDYESIDKLDVCHPLPRELNCNISRKLFEKESERSSLFQCRRGSSSSMTFFGDAVYGSLFSARKLELMRKLDGGDEHGGHEGCVNACNFNDDGSLLVSGSDDLQICIWDWAASDVARVKFASGHRQNVFQTKFLPYSNSSVVITCARDGQVRLAELSSDGKCKETRLLAKHSDSAHKLAIRHDSGSQFYSCGEDGFVKHYDLRDSRPSRDIVCVRKSRQRNISAGSSSVSSDGDNDRAGGEDVVTLYAIDCNPLNNNEFLVSGVDDAVRIYDLRYIKTTVNDDSNSYNALPIKTFCPAKFRKAERKLRHISASCAVYDWNGSSILASYNDHNVFEFDNRSDGGGGCEKSNFTAKTVHNDRPKHVFRGHRNRATVKGVNYFGPRSEFVVSGSDCGNVFLWHRETERVVNMLAADEQGVVNVLESHPTAPVLATSGLDHDIKIWVPSNESPILQSEAINRRAQKNIRDRKRNEKRPVMSMPSGFMVALLNHLNAQRERGGTANADNAGDEDDDDEDEAVRGGAAARRRQRQRARRAGRAGGEEAGGDNAENNDGDDDEDNDDGDTRPIRCGVQ